MPFCRLSLLLTLSGDSLFPFFRSSQVFFSLSGSVCAFRHWNCTMVHVQSNITPSFTAHLSCQCFFRPKMFFVHNPVAHIQAEFSAGGVSGCKFGNFQIPGCFNRSDIAPGTETDNDNSLNIKSQLQILLSQNLLLPKMRQILKLRLSIS